MKMRPHEDFLSTGQCNEPRSHRRYETENHTLTGTQSFFFRPKAIAAVSSMAKTRCSALIKYYFDCITWLKSVIDRPLSSWLSRIVVDRSVTEKCMEKLMNFEQWGRDVGWAHWRTSQLSTVVGFDAPAICIDEPTNHKYANSCPLLACRLWRFSITELLTAEYCFFFIYVSRFMYYSLILWQVLSSAKQRRIRKQTEGNLKWRRARVRNLLLVCTAPRHENILTLIYDGGKEPCATDH